MRRIVSPQHEIVIEGFPRSANSYFVKKFISQNGGYDIRVATHTHSPAQVKLAVNWKIPTVVLYRNPKDAILSWIALGIITKRQSQSNQEEVLKRIDLMLKRCIYFYTEILKLSGEIKLVDFAKVTKNYEQVNVELNDQFPTEFNAWKVPNEVEVKKFSKVKPHMLPNEARDNIKKSVEEIYLSIEGKELDIKARKIYKLLCERGANKFKC